MLRAIPCHATRMARRKLAKPTIDRPLHTSHSITAHTADVLHNSQLTTHQGSSECPVRTLLVAKSPARRRGPRWDLELGWWLITVIAGGWYYLSVIVSQIIDRLIVLKSNTYGSLQLLLTAYYILPGKTWYDSYNNLISLRISTWFCMVSCVWYLDFTLSSLKQVRMRSVRFFHELLISIVTSNNSIKRSPGTFWER